MADGVRQPNVQLETIRLAEGTPYEARLRRSGQGVFAVAQALAQHRQACGAQGLFGQGFSGHITQGLRRGLFTRRLGGVALNVLSQGLHTLNVRAVDASGNMGEASSFNLRVDSIAPTVTSVDITGTSGMASRSYKCEGPG